METRGQTVSPWMQVSTGTYAPLTQALECDVAIIGAGIVGLTTAYLASRAGLSVAVLEMAEVGAGDTGRTTAHFATANDNGFHSLNRYHGLRRMRLVSESLVECINQVEQIVREENIDCDFERLPGYLFLAPGDSKSLLDRELSAADRAGLAGVKKIGQLQLGQKSVGPSVVFPDQAQLHITKYLAGLGAAIERQGGKIFTQTRVTKISGQGPYLLKTQPGHVVTARQVVQGTNSPLYGPKLLFGKMPPFRTYVIAGRVPKGTLQKGLYWDTGFPYHYVRTQTADANVDWLIVGGEDHRTGSQNDGAARFARLEAWVREAIPEVGQVEFRWSGQVLESIDGLAAMGEYKKMPGVFFSTGDSGMGMTHGTIAGMVLTDLLQGKGNRWAEVYHPGRLRPRAWLPMTKEGLGLTKYFLRKWIDPNGISPEQLEPGEGTVVKRGKDKLAIHKDAAGTVQTRSAVCPHMGCIVAFNSTEQSWDCPCHGSRYQAGGQVINAPTYSNLGKK